MVPVLIHHHCQGQLNAFIMRKELLSVHYCDANSILVINQTGKLRKLYTPFRAECRQAVENLKQGTKVHVEEVQNTHKDELLFIINGRCYLHSYFIITINF